MGVKSTLLSNGSVLASWEGNEAVSSFFASYVDAFECNGDSVELLVTREMVDTMIQEIEDFLTGIQFQESVRWFEPLRADDVVLVYQECIAV